MSEDLPVTPATGATPAIPEAGERVIAPSQEPALGDTITDGAWTRVSTSYAWADLIVNLVLVAVVTVVFTIIFVINIDSLPLAVKLVLPAIIAVLIVNSLLAFRRVRAIGYILREDDLLFRRGIMFERIVAVPYGRLQLVDVTRGPLLRALGLATLKFVTASPATGVQLPGLKVEDAEALRDRLVELAEIRRSGL